MRRAASARLTIRALYGLARYDVLRVLTGFPFIHRELASQRPGPPSPVTTEAVCDAVRMATCFYWKPVRCLQRSVCLTRLLREYGIAARIVVGYRPVPFLCHAWVEVDGRAVNDSPAYQQRLSILYTT